MAQGELEHKTPKGRYKRTSRKGVQKQLAQIERRQARIRRIRKKLTESSLSVNCEPEQSNCDAPLHHHIGLSENHPQHIGSFIRAHLDDPATKVSQCFEDSCELTSATFRLSSGIFYEAQRSLSPSLEIALASQQIGTNSR